MSECIVLCRPENAVSAVKLGMPVYSVMPESHKGPVVNWGMSSIRCNGEMTAVLNKPEVVAGTVDKMMYLKALTAAGVSCPEMLVAGDVTPNREKWVIRPNNHSEGNEFNLSEVDQVIPGDHHATKFITPSREYRIWFNSDGQRLTAKRVPRRSEGQSPEDACRSKWGYQFLDENFPKSLELINKALEVAKLDFGAFDVLWAPEESKWYILEVNTAPSLDHEHVRRFFKPYVRRWAHANPYVEPPVPQSRSQERRLEVQTAAVEEARGILKIRKAGGAWIEVDITNL